MVWLLMDYLEQNILKTMDRTKKQRNKKKEKKNEKKDQVKTHWRQIYHLDNIYIVSP